MIQIKDGRQRKKRKERKEGEEKGKKREGEAVLRTAVFFSQRPGRECPFLLLCSPFYKVAQAQWRQTLDQTALLWLDLEVSGILENVLEEFNIPRDNMGVLDMLPKVMLHASILELLDIVCNDKEDKSS